MNSKALARNYSLLTPEERWGLDLAARARGDDAERSRLASAGPPLRLCMPEHTPYSDAFGELALLVFVELQELAALFHDANERANDTLGDLAADEEGDDQEEEGEDAEDEGPTAGSAEETGEVTAWPRSLALAYAAGYILRTKADGWKLFSERKTVPPFLLWEGLPGFARLRRDLDLAEKVSFGPDGFLRWMNAVRPSEEPELTAVPLTAVGMADATAETFEKGVEWWGG